MFRIFLTIHLLIIAVFNQPPGNSGVWGFEPHKRINRLAIFSLPPTMLSFYKYHIHYISEQAVAPDHRRYVVAGEGPRHYIDLDYYGDSVPRQWEAVIQQYPADSIQEHGILPWNLLGLKSRLTEAFRQRNVKSILKLSADGGHYLADAHVPLHTTSNYNGQYSGQQGIHGFWETRIPELLLAEFDLLVGKAVYQKNWFESLWNIVLASYHGVDSVLEFERELTKNFHHDRKYSYEVRLKQFNRVYSKSFSQAYHRMLDQQVERRFREAIKAVADFWYTCWVDGGQPDLSGLLLRVQPNYVDYQQVADSLWQKQGRKHE